MATLDKLVLPPRKGARSTAFARWGLPIVSLVLANAFATPAHAQADFGTIKGRLVWGGDQAPEAKVLVAKGDQTVKDPAVCAVHEIRSNDLVVDSKTKGVADGVAYLVKPSGTNPAAEKALLAKTEVEIDQKNCTFVPTTTAMHKDQALEFKSSDAVNHNVRYAAFTNAPFNQILPPNGTTKVTLVAEKTATGGYRPIPLACDIHPWMKGYIMVFDHPFFAVTQPDGSFEIKGVPPGMQNLVVWQGAAGFASTGASRGMPVKVTAGGVTDVGEIKIDPAKVKH